MVSEPKKYDMSKIEDLERWFREMDSYLNLEGNGFINQGTDFKGRKFALDGFYQLKQMLLKKEE